MIDLIFVALFQAAAGPAEPANTQPEPAATQSAGQSTAQAQTEQQPHERCRREIITGTRLTQRVCTTANQDQELADDSRDMLQRAQSGMPLHSN
jgi:hypothetical protein